MGHTLTSEVLLSKKLGVKMDVTVPGATLPVGSPAISVAQTPTPPPGGMPQSVCVFVRIRPMNDMEKRDGTELSFTAVSEKELTAQKPRVQSQHEWTEKRWTFDSVFPTEASQEKVFLRTAQHLISPVLEGYNACCFAYGQTGSGKTFTMSGTESSPGLIPRLCRDLFANIERDESFQYTVKASYIEIYQENLKDLLVPAGRNEGLQIREEKPVLTPRSSDSLVVLTPIYICASPPSATQSSRSHAVFSLHLERRNQNDAEGLTVRTSQLHLIDLAGSERQSTAGTAGDRLREGAAINVSLMALGNVISALTSERPTHIPYRDSKLTRLLSASLGGNSLTMILATISPAQLNFEESMSTIRFADRAKHIRNRPVINRDPKAARITELMAENQRLRAYLAQCTCGVGTRALRDMGVQTASVDMASEAGSVEGGSGVGSGIDIPLSPRAGGGNPALAAIYQEMAQVDADLAAGRITPTQAMALMRALVNKSLAREAAARTALKRVQEEGTGGCCCRCAIM
ncbi:putative Kinesin-II 85 kDa subunit [Paratrimastix pyriformis]|uniref:Kinesin-like protein n=1 Tax=Paratrimastix pyriformis TaxID=342808 RepID=A0ABQ8UA72_9EUKA|nr:putative Kinesin-II 85 kDa subunit [Paratrimastix pyriformis]